jgi:hypothetical protein
VQSPNEEAVNIRALASSFRKGSLNQALMKTARELAHDRVPIDDFGVGVGGQPVVTNAAHLELGETRPAAPAAPGGALRRRRRCGRVLAELR